MDDFELDPTYSEYKCGWTKEAHDERDRKYASVRHLEIPESLPSEVSLLAHCNSAFDQGQSSSCVGNATAGAITYLRNKEVDLIDWTASRMYIWYMTRKLEGNEAIDEGCVIRNAIKTTAKLGVPPEDEWPFDLTKVAEEPNAEVQSHALTHKTYNYYKVDWTDLREVKGCLAAGFPIVFGFMVPPKFMSKQVAQTGILEMITDPNTKFNGGHAVLAVGYSDERQAVLVRNSWGSKWGLNGNFWMPYEYITDPHLSDDFWTIRATY